MSTIELLVEPGGSLEACETEDDKAEDEDGSGLTMVTDELADSVLGVDIVAESSRGEVGSEVSCTSALVVVGLTGIVDDSGKIVVNGSAVTVMYWIDESEFAVVLLSSAAVVDEYDEPSTTLVAGLMTSESWVDSASIEDSTVGLEMTACMDEIGEPVETGIVDVMASIIEDTEAGASVTSPVELKSSISEAISEVTACVAIIESCSVDNKLSEASGEATASMLLVTEPTSELTPAMIEVAN